MREVKSSQIPGPHHLTSLQVFRALAAIWVLVFHVYGISHQEYGTPLDNKFLFAGGDAVSFFFVLSGFIIAYVHWRHLGVPGNVRPYLARRLSRIYPPVFAVVILKLLFIASTGSGVEKKALTVDSTVSSLLLLPAPVYLITVLWTLVFEIVFYVLFSVAVAFGRKAAIAGGVLWTLLVLGRHALGYPHEHETFLGTISHPLCLLFLMGAVSSRILMSPKWMPRLGWLWIPGLALMAFCVWFYGLLDSLPGSDATHAVMRTLLWGLASAMIILSAASCELRNGLRWPAWLNMLGDASYSIYLVHTSVIMVLIVILRRAHLSPGSGLVVAMVLAGFAALIASVLFWRWVEKPLMSWWNRRVMPVMSGGRKLQTADGETKPKPALVAEPES
jgi:peptidoglycan/LPS O-acetylase OafA/YrhL